MSRAWRGFIFSSPALGLTGVKDVGDLVIHIILRRALARGARADYRIFHDPQTGWRLLWLVVGMVALCWTLSLSQIAGHQVANFIKVLMSGPGANI
jgi:hypothetical protein